MSDDLPVAASTEISVRAPFAGVVVSIGDGHVAAGAPLVVLEAMKMEHEVLAESAPREGGSVLLRMPPG